MNRVSDEAHAVFFEFAFPLKAEFFHDSNGSGIRRPGYGDNSFQAYAVKRIPQRNAARFRCKTATPVRASKPPSNLRIEVVAPESHATEADHFPG